MIFIIDKSSLDSLQSKEGKSQDHIHKLCEDNTIHTGYNWLGTQWPNHWARPNWCKTVMFSCQARSYSQAQEWQDSHRSQTWWEGGVQTSVSSWGAAVWGTCEHEMCCSPWLPILYPLNQTSSNLTWFTQTMETKHHPYMQRTKSRWPGLATQTGSSITMNQSCPQF